MRNSRVLVAMLALSIAGPGCTKAKELWEKHGAGLPLPSGVRRLIEKILRQGPTAPGNSNPGQPAAEFKPYVAPATELAREDIRVGNGAVAEAGKDVALHLIAMTPAEKVIEDTQSKGAPLKVKLGTGVLAPGLEQSIPGMKVGGLRKISVPVELGHEKGKQPPGYPEGEPVVYFVELVGVE